MFAYSCRSTSFRKKMNFKLVERWGPLTLRGFTFFPSIYFLESAQCSFFDFVHCNALTGTSIAQYTPQRGSCASRLSALAFSHNHILFSSLSLSLFFHSQSLSLSLSLSLFLVFHHHHLNTPSFNHQFQSTVCTRLFLAFGRTIFFSI